MRTPLVSAAPRWCSAMSCAALLLGGTGAAAAQLESEAAAENTTRAEPEATEPRAPNATGASLEAGDAEAGDAEAGNEELTNAARPGLPRTIVSPPGGVPEIRSPFAPRPAPSPAPPPEPPAPPPPPPIYAVELSTWVHLPEGSSFDRALRAHRHRSQDVIPRITVGAAAPIPGAEILWLGGRLGLRGRAWPHPNRESAVALATDLTATVQVRGMVARVLEFGLLLAGGIGIAEFQGGGARIGTALPRVGVEGSVRLLAGRHFGVGLVGGWDFMKWDGVDGAGNSLELGGGTLGLTVEGRE